MDLEHQTLILLIIMVTMMILLISLVSSVVYYFGRRYLWRKKLGQRSSGLTMDQASSTTSLNTNTATPRRGGFSYETSATTIQYNPSYLGDSSDPRINTEPCVSPHTRRKVERFLRSSADNAGFSPDVQKTLHAVVSPGQLAQTNWMFGLDLVHSVDHTLSSSCVAGSVSAEGSHVSKSVYQPQQDCVKASSWSPADLTHLPRPRAQGQGELCSAPREVSDSQDSPKLTQPDAGMSIPHQREPESSTQSLLFSTTLAEGTLPNLSKVSPSSLVPTTHTNLAPCLSHPPAGQSLGGAQSSPLLPHHPRAWFISLGAVAGRDSMDSGVDLQDLQNCKSLNGCR